MMPIYKYPKQHHIADMILLWVESFHKVSLSAYYCRNRLINLWFLLDLHECSKIMPNMDITEIASTLRERRKFLKITQGDLADISGISERTLRDIEKGIANPELESLLKLCDVLGMELTINVIKVWVSWQKCITMVFWQVC
jgi:y4mF family transcriptional regulator